LTGFHYVAQNLNSSCLSFLSAWITGVRHAWLSFVSLFPFCSTGVWTQGLVLARQFLYNWAAPSALLTCLFR
jgi:uncharacterized membrane protein